MLLKLRHSTYTRSRNARASGLLRRRVLSAVHGDTTRFSGSESHGFPLRSSKGRQWLCFATGLTTGVALAGVLVAVAILARSPRAAPPAKAPVGAHASLRRAGIHEELVVSGMSQPPIGTIYELWVDRDGDAPQPTDALFQVSSAGHGTIEVPGSPRGIKAVLVTNEPLGGSSMPTSMPILRVTPPR
jgi:Anti-sigma-K factor rskA